MAVLLPLPASGRGLCSYPGFGRQRSAVGAGSPGGNTALFKVAAGRDGTVMNRVKKYTDS